MNYPWKVTLFMDRRVLETLLNRINPPNAIIMIVSNRWSPRLFLFLEIYSSIFVNF